MAPDAQTSRRSARPPPPRTTPTGGTRQDGRIGTTLRVPPRLHAALKRLALDLSEQAGRNVTVQELFIDGLLLVFEAHGRTAPARDE
jgi:hypothetical protein